MRLKVPGSPRRYSQIKFQKRSTPKKYNTSKFSSHPNFKWIHTLLGPPSNFVPSIIQGFKASRPLSIKHMIL